MARLSNEEIRRMSLDEADAYTDAHPAEAWRFAKAHGASAARQTKKALAHGFKAVLLALSVNKPCIFKGFTVFNFQ